MKRLMLILTIMLIASSTTCFIADAEILYQTDHFEMLLPEFLILVHVCMF